MQPNLIEIHFHWYGPTSDTVRDLEMRAELLKRDPFQRQGHPSWRRYDPAPLPTVEQLGELSPEEKLLKVYAGAIDRILG